MNKRWKNLFLLSSMGSLVIGAGIAMVGKKRKRDGIRGECKRIPAECRRILIWTEPLELEQEGRRAVIRERYVLQSTAFKVWSVLELPVSAGTPNPEGATVYHISWFRNTEISGEQGPEETDRFYGTVATARGDQLGCRKNHLARGALLEIRKCFVGGASNGVETGEVHRSVAPILNYRFEYASEENRKPGAEAAAPGDSSAH